MDEIPPLDELLKKCDTTLKDLSRDQFFAVKGMYHAAVTARKAEGMSLHERFLYEQEERAKCDFAAEYEALHSRGNEDI